MWFVKDVTDEQYLPTARRLPDHLRDDADGPSRSDEEKGAKRLRSTSTTPRSVRGTDPDEYDRRQERIWKKLRTTR